MDATPPFAAQSADGSGDAAAPRKPVRKAHNRQSNRRSAVDRLDDPPPATGIVLLERVTQAIEYELNQIETIIGGRLLRSNRQTEAERRARTLASLARTLRVVTQLRAAHPQRPEDDDDDRPRDLDELRETLARRLEGLVADRAQSDPCESEPE